MRRAADVAVGADEGTEGRVVVESAEEDGATAPTTPAVDAPTAGAGVAVSEGLSAAAWACAASTSNVAVCCVVESTVPRPDASPPSVDDTPLTRERRVGAGATASSGVIRLNYLVPAGAIIIASTRESGVPG